MKRIDVIHKDSSDRFASLMKGEKFVAILAAAECIIQSDGLQALSISKVAKQAKIAKGTVYIYFESKEEIIGELTIKARRRLLEYFKSYCEVANDSYNKIKNIFWADYYFFKDHHTYHELVTFYEQNTGLKETEKLSMASFEISKYVNSIIDEAVNNKAIRHTTDSSLLGYVFWGMAVGILQIIDTKGDQLQKYFGKSEIEFYEYFIDSLMKGMLPYKQQEKVA